MAFILELASRWEFQPDSQDIHMAFPSKVVSFGVLVEKRLALVILNVLFFFLSLIDEVSAVGTRYLEQARRSEH